MLVDIFGGSVVFVVVLAGIVAANSSPLAPPAADVVGLKILRRSSLTAAAEGCSVDLPLVKSDVPMGADDVLQKKWKQYTEVHH